MRKYLAFFPVRLIAPVAAIILLASCSGGCPSCNVPSFHSPTLAPGATPTPPGFIPPPATPTPAPTATPSPIPALACSQGGPSTIALGAAAPFALLGAGGITNTGNTFVNFATGAVSVVPPFGTFNDDLIGAYPTTTVAGITEGGAGITISSPVTGLTITNPGGN